MGWPVLDGGADLELAFCSIGSGVNQHVAGVVLRSPLVARLDAHLQSALGRSPGRAMLAHPGPTFTQLAFEIALKQDFIRVNGDGERSVKENSRKQGFHDGSDLLRLGLTQQKQSVNEQVFTSPP